MMLYDKTWSRLSAIMFPPTLYKLGQHQLDRLLAFVKEEGVDIYAKCEVFPAVVQIGLRHPERREEVIEWFRQVLRFATEDLPEGDAFDSELAGLLVCDIIDLQVVELKPELDIDGILKPFMPQNLRGESLWPSQKYHHPEDEKNIGYLSYVVPYAHLQVRTN